VSPALLLLGRHGELVVLNGDVGLHLLDGFVGNGESQLYRA
jgi:hypothetical protein